MHIATDRLSLVSLVHAINVLLQGMIRVATVREKYLENEIFSRSGKSVDGLGNFERTWKIREKSGNLKINGFGRQSSENLYILFKRGKDVLSHEIKPISFLIGGYSYRKEFTPLG